MLTEVWIMSAPYSTHVLVLEQWFHCSTFDLLHFNNILLKKINTVEVTKKETRPTGQIKFNNKLHRPNLHRTTTVSAECLSNWPTCETKSVLVAYRLVVHTGVEFTPLQQKAEMVCSQIES